jgi:hypothetical protein
MARLTGDFKFTGTIDSLCFYKMYGDHFVRTKSSLTGKRFWKDTAFEGSRRSCNLLAKASALTSLFYKTYPVEKRRKGLFNEMTGKVKLWLKEGKTEEEARLLLKKNYPVLQKEIKEEQRRVKKTRPYTVKKKEKLFTVLINGNIAPYKRKHTPKKLCYDECRKTSFILLVAMAESREREWCSHHYTAEVLSQNNYYPFGNDDAG